MSKFWCYAAVSVLLAAAVLFRATLSPFLAAAAVAYILDMPARGFERLFSRIGRQYLRRPMAVSAALLSVTALAALFISLLVPRIAESAGMLSERLPEYWSALCSYLEELPVPEAVRRFFEEQDFSLMDQLSEMGNTFFSNVWSITRNASRAVASSVSDIFTSLVCCLYMLFCKNSILSQCKTLFSAILPLRTYHKLLALFHMVNEVFSRYISGRVIESAVLIALCLVGLLLSGIPYAPLLSMIVGISNLIPFLGPLVGTIPCLLLLVEIDPVKALWFLIFILALQQLDNNIISPRIVGSSVGLPAFWSMIAVLLGARLYGAAGAFLSVPCAAVFYHLLSRYIHTRT